MESRKNQNSKQWRPKDFVTGWASFNNDRSVVSSTGKNQSEGEPQKL